jgi:hypothetical protein
MKAEGVGFEPTDVLRRQRISSPLNDRREFNSGIEKSRSDAADTAPATAHATDDAELSLVIARWRDVPDAIRAGIVAMVKASKD